MRVLRPPTLPEVLDLHDLGKERDVDGGLCRLRKVVLPEHLGVLVERALVPVLLQEPLLPLWLLFASLLGTLEVLLESLLFREGTPSLDLLALALTCKFSLFVALDAGELAQSPCFKLASRVEAISIVDIWSLLFLLLYERENVFENVAVRMRGGDALSRSSRRMLSATMSWLAFLRSSASSSFRFSASSESCAMASFSATVARARLRDSDERSRLSQSEDNDVHVLWHEHRTELELWFFLLF